MGGQQLQLRISGPHLPDLSPGAREGPPRQGDSIWDQHPRPSIRPVELGPWNGEPAAAEKTMICPLSTFARTAPDGPCFRPNQDEPGRKFDSTDQAPKSGQFLSPFFLSFSLAAFRVAGFPVLSWSPLSCPVGRDGPGLRPERKRPIQDLSDWLGIHLPEGEPKAGPPLTSALA